ncbi:MAG: deoxyguanosinetriphosphate triphosphohydrolase [Clostridia bacterium]|nr:deoxyguanosinetriphosphate triphosphohydrolase [Clostridia bacterium]
MNLREKSEERERKFLSPYAALSSQNGGRNRFEEPCDFRTDFQRDRDRVIHSKAFRRLKHKTQVFLAPEGDHYRTRLTHTLEVSQIARTIARALDLNEDLTEAISLGHDLGHTPFGHTGERALNALCPQGFRHNEQSLRVVNVLERKGGLNLTHEVRDGILCHTGSKEPQTLEGKIVRFADRIAYINHDIDDAVRAGVLSQSDIPKEFSDILGTNHSDRIDTLIRSMIASSTGNSDISMQPEVYNAMMGLRQFMFENVYRNPYAKSEESKFYAVVEALFEKLCKDPSLIPESIRLSSCSEDTSIVVRDYIAGMTDRYAVSLFEEIFVPKAWNI